MVEPTLLSEIRSRHNLVRQKLATLDEVLRELEASSRTKGGLKAEIQAPLSELAAFFTGDLRRLIDLEEEAFFPPLDRRLREIGGPVAALRLEHEELKRLAEIFSAMVAAFERHEAATVHTLQWCAERLRSLLLLNLEKKETVLFDLAQKVLTLNDWAEATERARLWEKEAGL